MREKIIDELENIESEHGIEIISARETGSRLLGAAHGNSDWDIMFVYHFTEAWKYPASGYSKKTITHEAGEMDLHGWNLDKFAVELHDSDPNAIEFLRAGTYTQTFDDMWIEIERDAQKNFNRMALYHHYISLAKSNYKQYIENGNDCTKGRQFYVARAIACAQHIRRTDEMPPMDAMNLAENGDINNRLTRVLRALTKAKRDGAGSQKLPDIVGNLYSAESETPMMPENATTTSPDAELMNKLFKQAL